MLAAVNRMTMEIKTNLDRFNWLIYPVLLDNVHCKLADMIGANTNECVLVPSASMGIKVVLRNF